ncbi:MAG: DUF1188 domain-containing protein [Methanobrevibacter woesei]|nr:DUF1188 domain-containing protein [Methanobrevibacter woesei]
MKIEEIDTGITEEVFTIKSQTKLIDIFNSIIDKKSQVSYEWVLDLDIDKNSKIIVIGTYFTGIGIVKKLAKTFNDVLLIDIYPHLKEFINVPIGDILTDEEKDNISFSSDLDLIYSGDVVIDTTGFGGITVEQSSKFDVKGFLIEDPVAEDNDILLKNKNNIYDRINAVKSENKAIIKTHGINTKTSGTMTLTIGVLTNALNKSLKKEGVLYSACEMGFFEEVIFKEKDISKFIELTDKQAMKISTINPFNCDDLLNEEIDKIHSRIITQ